MVSGSISPGSPPCFSPFPHGTSALSVRRTYLALAGSTACFLRDFRFSEYSRKITRSAKGFSPTGLLPSMVPLSRVLRLTNLCLNTLPRQAFLCTRNAPDVIFLQPLNKNLLRFGLFPFRSPLLREWFCAKAQNFVSFPPLTEMFHFSGFASRQKNRDVPIYHRNGFPHSEIPGSQVAKHLPEAYRSHATSFIAAVSRGIHHLPIKCFSWPVTDNHFILFFPYSVLRCFPYLSF